LELDRAGLRRLLCEALRACRWEESSETRLRLTVDCSETPGEIWLSVEPLPLPRAEEYREGVAVLTRKMHRENPKAKNNAFLVASQEARKLIGGRINEVLMVGPDGKVLEGLSSNFFGIRHGTLYTADEGVLPGITRSLILEEAERAETPVQLEAIAAADLATLDEAFISSTSRAVLPVVEIEGRRLGEGKPGPVTQQLGARYSERLRQEVKDVCGKR
jgi:branched-chain amino acid aminotransferase